MRSALLSASPAVDDIAPPLLDDLLSHSTGLLSASDELVSALDVPQEKGALAASLAASATAVRSLRDFLEARGLATSASDGDKLAGLTAMLKLEPSDRDARSEAQVKLAKERKWFDACFAQIAKAAEAIEGLLVSVDAPSAANAS